jgi:DNA repair exonuclease SbcCD ATPase subunit
VLRLEEHKIEERKDLPLPGALLSKGALDRPSINQRLDAGPTVPLIARDSYVVETATKIDQMQAAMRLIVRDVADLSAKMSVLQTASDQDQRWYAFQQSEKRTREAKLEELMRGCRDLKTRLDRIEGRGDGNFHAYNSLEAVSRKLAELEHFKDEAQRVERRVTLRAWMFCGALALAATIVAVSNVIAG